MAERQPLPAEGERLAKRVAALQGCSRRDAEALIEGGWVRVDGAVAHSPAQRVSTQTITVDVAAQVEALVPVVLLWHKPVGVALADDQPLQGLLAPAGDLLPWHVQHLRCVSPMPAHSSGMALFVQQARLRPLWRQLVAECEQEWMVDVTGPAPLPSALQALPMARTAAAGRSHLKVSVGSQNASGSRLRLALKGLDALDLPRWLQAAGLAATALRRQRLGRLALGAVAAGGWRILGPQERL